MPSLISLDIETTGLDPNQDAIIEIGAVRFNEKRIEAEYSQLINPRRPVSQFITNLTGISNTMLMNQPYLVDLLPEVLSFIGDATIVGHNVGFDLSFFHKLGALRTNPTIDTYELASVLLPKAARYNLAALAQALGVVQANAHRALDDARATHGVYRRLMEVLESLPIELVAEILRLSKGLNWGGELPFRAVLKNMAQKGIKARKLSKNTEGEIFLPGQERHDLHLKPLEPNKNLQALDVEALASILQPGGEFASHFPAFEHRSQQVQVLKAIAEAFNHSDHLMVEAGTGIGKSLAYLIPAADWAIKNGERVVISTNTIALQDQLISKDIPDLTQALGLNLHAAVLKGRGNYLCPRRLNAMRRRGPETVDELRVLAKILVWRESSQSDDRSEINLNGPVERLVWSRLSAEDENCKLELCLKREGGRCPFYKARMAAEAAHILIVNHALLLADAATQNRVLPAYNYLVVDEAHHLESATTDAMSFRLRTGDVTRLVREIGSPEQGLLGRVLTAARELLKPDQWALLDQAANLAADKALRFDIQLTAFFRTLEDLQEELREGKPLGSYPQQTRILPSIRTLPSWLPVEIAWEEAEVSLDLLLRALQQVREVVGRLADAGMEEVEDSLGSLSSIATSLEEIGCKITALVMEPEPDQIYWVEQDPLQNRLSLMIAPLHIGNLMQKYLWHEKASVILTSATLTTHGEFDYLKRRLNAEDASELSVGSPFDYENAALLYLPSNVPEPSDFYGHQRMTEDTLIRLAKATGGRMLALFTSYAQLQKTSRAIQGPLAQAGITVFEQGEGASASALLDAFKETPQAVLLGTRAFWEGVDVPGEALSVLVIVKLPFDVPSDPIIAARSESFEDPFREYNLPEAILRFRQGFGRLIRTQTDRGVVVILDKRLMSKSYGRLFIESLPLCNLQQGLLANLPETAAKWLGS